MVTTNPVQGLLYINNGYSAARWNYDGSPGSIGQPATVTYSFGSDRPSYASIFDSSFDDITAFSPDYQAATRSALAQVASVTNLRFVQAQPGEQGDIVFRHSAQQFTSGFAYSPDFTYSTASGDYTPTGYAGDVWIDNIDTFTAAELQPGGRGYFVLMHEIGHALGLQHSFDDTDGASPPPYVMADSLDNQAHTVMTYTDAPRSGLLTVAGDPSFQETWSTTQSAETLMPLDIQALQHLYGANRTTASGNDTYRWDTNQEILRTIWDGGGTDTIDASNQIFKCVINLNAGQYSSIGLRETPAQVRQGLDIPDFYTGTLPADLYNGKNNLAIAVGAVIENASGGSAADSIAGNSAANQLSGGMGNDSLGGGGGNDILQGNAGSDRMLGGTGNDVYYVGQTGDVVLEATGAGTDTVYSSLANYVLGSNVENGRVGTAGAVNITGNALANGIFAGAGNNVLAGGGGVDTLSYANGLVAGTAGVTVSLATALAQNTGGSGTDQISGFENLAGSALADRLTGSSVRNVLNGGSGNDQLSGAAGDDFLMGGQGRDQLTGGAGADTFDFNAPGESGTTAAAADVIRDFTRGIDRIDLSGIDARATTASNDAFVYIGTAAFSSTNATGQLRLAVDTAGNGIVFGSTDSDAQAELAIQLTGVNNLAVTDLVL